MQGSITAQELLDQARADLTEVERAIREHPFLDALESGRAPRSVLEALAGERPPQLRAARDALPGRSRRGVLPVDGEGEGLALGLLQDFATAVGVGPDWLAAYEPSPDCQAYPRACRVAGPERIEHRRRTRLPCQPLGLGSLPLRVVVLDEDA